MSSVQRANSCYSTTVVVLFPGEAPWTHIHKTFVRLRSPISRKRCCFYLFQFIFWSVCVVLLLDRVFHLLACLFVCLPVCLLQCLLPVDHPAWDPPMFVFRFSVASLFFSYCFYPILLVFQLQQNEIRVRSRQWTLCSCCSVASWLSFCSVWGHNFCSYCVQNLC